MKNFIVSLMIATTAVALFIIITHLLKLQS